MHRAEYGPQAVVRHPPVARPDLVQVVQARLRHASAKTTLDTYGHMRPSSEERMAAAIDAALAVRTQGVEAGTGSNDEGPPTDASADPRADHLRTTGGPRPLHPGQTRARWAYKS